MKWLAIINPHADHHSPEQVESLKQELSRQIGADCIQTACPWQASAIAAEANGYNGFIAVGGDGTISEVINGLGGHVPHLGFIPAGTGNGLAHDLGMTDEYTAVRALRRPRFARLDLIWVRSRCAGQWRGRFMLSTSGIGYVAGATELGMGLLRRLNGSRYALAAFLQAWRQQEFTARLRLDDGPWEEHRLTNLAVHNTQYVGTFWLFPQARVDDGKLDVLLGRLSSIGQLVEDLAILTKTFFFNHSERRQARSIDIELPQPALLMVDGDLTQVEAVHYQILPGRLYCCVGPAWDQKKQRPHRASTVGTSVSVEDAGSRRRAMSREATESPGARSV